jgi:hypothetical protein
MSTPKKPGDTTLPPLPNSLKGKSPLDSYDGTMSASGNFKALTEAAPEVSQGAWRERAFSPRGVMSKEDILANLATALKDVATPSGSLFSAWEALRAAWKPLLRQAMEQVGGDGMDAWLQVILTNSTRKPLDLFFQEMTTAVSSLSAATNMAEFETEALKTIELTKIHLAVAKPKRISFKHMERHLEGKLEVDDLMWIRFSSTRDLQSRFVEIGGTMEQLREQIKVRPGKQPDGIYSNFTRLKYEVTVIDAELKHREKEKPIVP